MQRVPHGHITISTLLPRKDVPSEMINAINRAITTDCAALTGVRVTHHPTLTPQHLYGHVHLDRSSVWMSAEDLRGAAPSPHPIRGAPRQPQGAGRTAHPSQRSPPNRALPGTAHPSHRSPPNRALPGTAHPSQRSPPNRAPPGTAHPPQRSPPNRAPPGTHPSQRSPPNRAPPGTAHPSTSPAWHGDNPSGTAYYRGAQHSAVQVTAPPNTQPTYAQVLSANNHPHPPDFGEVKQYWNIQGLYSSIFGFKSTHSDSHTNISGHDIIVLLETWCRDDTNTHCPPNYREILLPSLKHSNIKHGRDSGGVVIWYKEELSSSLFQIERKSTYVWLKLNKNTIQCNKDIYIYINIYLCSLHAPFRVTIL